MDRRGQDGGGVGTHAEKGAMAERYLSRIAHKDIQTDRRDGRNAHCVDDIEHVGTAQGRQEDIQQAQTDPKAESAEVRLEDCELLLVMFPEIPTGMKMEFLHY
jgi:hypothetical protein